ncbi:hypothetical protein B0O99DRAFT_650487 [Bisporella sp. PMI_857]|nr:hypothetical protein B0O99DRAFT_650487 [Bisporella sp. PMI_857]
MAAIPPPSSSSARRSRTGESSRTGDKAVGNFSIDEHIGKGSFAEVYKGKNKKTGALVAIKSVYMSKLNSKLKDNLYCEIEILRGLQHPHIVALIDCRESASHIHLVMEYCELGDLSWFIRRKTKLGDVPALKDMVRKYPVPAVGGLNEVVVRHFLKQLVSAMEFLRAKNLIHRDVKPQNLLLLPSPKYLAEHKDLPLVMSASQVSLIPAAGLASLPMLKLADFGFARSLPATSLAETLCGSPLYMAPEILRYEKYDAKADLWSLGTVLYEMICGRPPFRAINHVELLRKIEQTEDMIKFPKDVEMSRSVKELIRSLLKQKSVERLPFEDLFSHPVIVEPIPNTVEDDKIQVVKAADADSSTLMTRQSSSHRRNEPAAERDGRPVTGISYSSSPRDRQIAASPKQQLAEATRTPVGTSPRNTSTSQSPRIPSSTQRPVPIQSATAPTTETLQSNRPPPRNFNPVAITEQRRAPSRQSSADEAPRKRRISQADQDRQAAEQAEQDVRDERDYVVIQKKSVEVNAFADEMNGMLPRAQVQQSARGQIARRATTQGSPTSATGAVPPSPSRVVQIAQGRPRKDSIPQRQNSYGRSYGTSPSTTGALAKAIQGATIRMLGVNWSPTFIGKGVSPPQVYNAFPAYPAPPAAIGLIADGKANLPMDEDQRTVHVIEESATRSDVVYGFAEVKYKQLIPLAPSMDHGLGGPSPEKFGDFSNEDDGLTIEATVAISEEALVLYVKALSLLAKSMDIAGSWWIRRGRGEVLNAGQVPRNESSSAVNAGNRINSAVQWVRNRFNEVLEKAEFVRLKLIEAQKKLPEDHPGHPSRHSSASMIAGTSSTDGAILSSGITAEKLMWERALEMSKSAAINEITNTDLPGCEISYITAIRMLEAVLEDDEEVPAQRPRASSLSMEMKPDDDGSVNGIKPEDRKDVQKVISMIQNRLAALKNRPAYRAQTQPLPPSPRPTSNLRSGSNTPALANTPPQ